MSDIQTLLRLTAEITVLLHNAMLDTIDDNPPATPQAWTTPDDRALAAHPEPDPLITYDIPGAPPTERCVTGMGRTWQRRATGMWRLVSSVHDEQGGRPDGSDDVRWVDVLTDYGPVTLVPLTTDDELDAALYGPPGARWGLPDVACPYRAEGEHRDIIVPCHLGLNHAGAHRDQLGNELGMTRADLTHPTAARITPQEAAEVPCTCGTPAAHQPGCARYDRMVGHHNGGRFDDQG